MKEQTLRLGLNHMQKCQLSLFQRKAPYFNNAFLSILTPKFGNLPISGKLCVIKVAGYIENFPIFSLNPPCFLDGMLVSLHMVHSINQWPLYRKVKHQP